MKTMTIRIFPTGGKVTIEMEGFKGDECLQTSEKVEKALGGDITKRDRKPEADEMTVDNVLKVKN
jgi:hypothetical protein